jgi:hypothetical protein
MCRAGPDQAQFPLRLEAYLPGERPKARERLRGEPGSGWGRAEKILFFVTFSGKSALK